MPVSPASVSSETSRTRVLVIGLNWLGDAVMSMPALAVLRERHPEAHFTVLTRPALAGLWALAPGVDAVATQCLGTTGVLRTIGAIRKARFDTAWVMPKSFRAALLAYWGNIPERVGLAGHGRDWMLTRVVRLPEGDRRHQVYEYLDLVGAGPGDQPLPPFLRASPDALASVQRERDALGIANAPLVGIMPGAARGPSKRWPAERFAEVARQLVSRHGCRIVVLGSAADEEACGAVTAAAGAGVTNLAGRTGLDALAAWLSLCRVVVANDSGGMHLAAGLGVPVVGIFGVTDPSRTGPVGRGNRLVLAEGVDRSRAVPRVSEAARAALLSINVEHVYGAVEEVLGGAATGSA